jgi:hypothetical protein
MITEAEKFDVWEFCELFLKPMERLRESYSSYGEQRDRSVRMTNRWRATFVPLNSMV